MHVKMPLVLICTLLRTTDVEHLFMRLLSTGMSSLDKHLFKLFAHFFHLIKFLFIVETFCFSMRWIQIPHQVSN